MYRFICVWGMEENKPLEQGLCKRNISPYKEYIRPLLRACSLVEAAPFIITQNLSWGTWV